MAVAPGQLRIGEKTHTRLIVPDHLEFIVDTPELIVDTLIMDDRSTPKVYQTIHEGSDQVCPDWEEMQMAWQRHAGRQL